MNEERRGPFLKAAFLCDTVIEGKDGTNSYIRVVDQLTVQAGRVILRRGQTTPPAEAPADALPELPEGLPDGSSVEAWFVLMITGGGARGRQPLMIRIKSPDGLWADLAGPLDINFDGRVVGGGVNFHMRINMIPKQEGPYELHAVLDDRDFAHVFFEVRYQRI